MVIGYACVSTQDQRLDIQLHALSAIGCEDENINNDTPTGKLTDRPGLQDALGKLRRGDTFVAWKRDRLGGSAKQFVDLVSGFEETGANFKSITDSIDTSTPSGRFFFHVMASLAEMERELIVERTRAGLAAERLGRRGGRKRLMPRARLSLHSGSWQAEPHLAASQPILASLSRRSTAGSRRGTVRSVCGLPAGVEKDLVVPGTTSPLLCPWEARSVVPGRMRGFSSGG